MKQSIKARGISSGRRDLKASELMFLNTKCTVDK
jgi:hypothetical protein